MKEFYLKLGKRARIPSITSSVNNTLEFPASTIIQEKEMKCLRIGQKEIKLSLFADDMIVYVENLKESAFKLPVIKRI